MFHICLKPVLQQEVKAFKPANLLEAISLSKLHEDELIHMANSSYSQYDVPGSATSFSSNSNSSFQKNYSVKHVFGPQTYSSKNHVGGENDSKKKTLPIKKMNPVELALHREKDL